jgi:dipeptidyl aminopeptidase/acylaminoacyl peptidase
VADDIGFTHFGDPYTGTIEPILFSPDLRYFAVQTGRGLLDQNRFESELRIFSSKDVSDFIDNPKVVEEPSPVWTIRKSTYKDGPIITGFKWARDSKGITFLAKNASNKNQLFFGLLSTKSAYALTPGDQDVTGFDFRDRRHFVYSVRSPAILDGTRDEAELPGIVATGRSLQSLIFPVSRYPYYKDRYDLSELWAVFEKTRFRIRDRSTGRVLSLHLEGTQALALSPDGRSVVTVLGVGTIPPEWELLYPPPIPSHPFRVRAGKQDLDALEGVREITEYVLIDLDAGSSKVLTDAPTGDRAGWYGAVSAAWSREGRYIALSNTFVGTGESTDPRSNRPCTAVADLATSSVNCVEYLKGETATGYEDGWHYIERVCFVQSKNNELQVEYQELGGSKGATNYLRADDGSWKPRFLTSLKSTSSRNFEITVRQGLNDPPVLVATDKTKNVSRVILDPNPQLKAVNLNEASTFKWKDKSGRDWVGGLYQPADYVPGHRYPLVIQTHGFKPDQFIPSGIYPTAFAARELAAEGILVLQVPDCRVQETPQEGPCNVSGYEAAVEKLVSEKMVDPDRIGIVGFSRSCYYVMQALTSSTVHFRAASITDGINEGYLQYLVTLDTGFNLLAHDAEVVNGAPPFGTGLEQWLQRSPEFKMDRVTTPLLIAATDPYVVLAMWEPYAALRYLNRPVDLIILGPGTHLLSNPAQRMASQGGTVDWFRFWLQSKEDSVPAKAQQYLRWRRLRDIQKRNAPQDVKVPFEVQ